MTIHDRFSKLPVSRERKRQLRKLAKGLCQEAACNKKKVTSRYCKAHAIQEREEQRLKNGHVRRNNSLTYNL